MWIVNRFKEASTWRGLIAIAAIAGYHFNQDLSEPLAAIVVSALAVIEIVRKEKTDARPEIKPVEGAVAVDPVIPEQAGSNP